jgi:hypothetical protein
MTSGPAAPPPTQTGNDARSEVRCVLDLEALDIAITDGDTDRSGHHRHRRRVRRGLGAAVLPLPSTSRA